MTPQDIERVFGNTRLRMTTGEHVEVFREAAATGERRRYTKRFLATGDADFRQWTEREWRILARLIGHGVRSVPAVVQFDGGAVGGMRQVQTYDAGVTVDQWGTLLPVSRDHVVRRHVFEDCAHWWALAHHCLVALDEIHALELVHLDIKADNICIPYAPGDFDPLSPGAELHLDFERLALIDFAFSVITRERLASALPIGWQKDYDYQSPRLLRALEAGAAGDLALTQELDWRADLYSLAAMLRRYLPDEQWAREQGIRAGWTAGRYEEARALIYRLRDAHDRELPPLRPHRTLLDVTREQLAAPDLQAALARGWTLAHGEPTSPADSLATPMTRIAPPRVPLAGPVAPTVVTEVPAVFRPTRVRIIVPANTRIAEDAAPAPKRNGKRTAALVCGIAAAIAVAAPFVTSEEARRWATPSGERLAATTAAADSRRETANPPDAQPASPATVAPPADAAPAAVEPASAVASEAEVQNVASAAAEAPSEAVASPPEEHGLQSETPVAVAPAPPPPTAEAPPLVAEPKAAAPVPEPPRVVAAPKPTPSVKTESPTRSTRSGRSHAPSHVATHAQRRTTLASATPAPRGGRTTTVVQAPSRPQVAAIAHNTPATTPPAAVSTPSAPPPPAVAQQQPPAASAPAPVASAPPVVAPIETPPAPVAAPAPASVPAPAARSVASAPPPRTIARAAPQEPWRAALRDVLTALGVTEQRAAPIEDRSVPGPRGREPERTAPVQIAPAAPPVALARAETRPIEPPQVITAPLARVDPPLRAEPEPMPRVMAAPEYVPRRVSRDEMHDDLRYEGRRMLNEIVPRVAAQARNDVSGVLWLAAAAESTSQNRAVFESAQGRWSSEGTYIPGSSASVRARQFHGDARQALASGRTGEAADLALRAFAADPRDPEIAGFLAAMHLRMRPMQAETARQLALHALVLSGSGRVQRMEDWHTLAIASALTGRETDATRALFAELALTPNLDQSCRAALGAYNAFGERVRAPVQALLERVHAQGRDYTARSCTWPAYRLARQ